MSDAWDNLKESYLGAGLTVVLGAGISLDSGIPSWRGLVEGLLERKYGTQARGTFAELAAGGLSLTTITQFIKLDYQENEVDFVNAIKDILYRHFPCRDVLQAYDEPGITRIIDHMHSRNPSLVAVYNLCTAREGDTLKPNPRVPYVVNFNIDSLLEAYDAARCCKNKPRSEVRCLHKVESAASDRLVGRTSVYHPHGYLRFENRPKQLLGRESDSVVLSEYEYYDFYNNPTKIFTYTFLHILRETSCLFIGMSMTDENVRRLLYLSKQEFDSSRQLRKQRRTNRCRHYAILKKTGPVTESVLIATLVGLSVEPLWIQSFADLPELLNRLTSSHE